MEEAQKEIRALGRAHAIVAARKGSEEDAEKAAFMLRAAKLWVLDFKYCAPEERSFLDQFLGALNNQRAATDDEVAAQLQREASARSAGHWDAFAADLLAEAAPT